MPLKMIFRASFIFWALVSVCASAFLLFTQPAIYWAGPLVAGLAPMINLVLPYDTQRSAHHKVKLPRVSLLVMLSVALVLLTIPERGLALWLTLGCLGGFLLDTYWAREPV
ncbi:hypothetical protein KFE80_05120 [bacterium SCSIO 12696]|nr:hypothetical protein KFE80_05120 [bacterium SCSIO 12696]